MDNRLHYTLDAKDTLDTKDRILLCLAKQFDQRQTMLALSANAGVPYATLHRTVQRIKPLLVCEQAGKAVLLSLERANPITKHHIIIAADAERQAFLATQPLLRAISKDIPRGDYAVVLFGSYAKGTQTARSDIDLLVINRTGSRTPSFSAQESLFKIPINPIYITPEEFKAMLDADEENVGKQALRNHIVLHRPDLFWMWAYSSS